MPNLKGSTEPVKKIGQGYLEQQTSSPTLLTDVPVGQLIDLEEGSSEVIGEETENQPVIDPVPSSSRGHSFPPEDVEERECEDDENDEDSQLKLVPLHNEDTLPVKTDEEEEEEEEEQEKLEDYERTNDGRGEKPNSSSDENKEDAFAVGPMNGNELQEIPHLTKEGMENQAIVDPVPSTSSDLSFLLEDIEERECDDDNDEDSQLKLVPLHNEDTLLVKTDEEEEEKLEDYERTNDGREEEKSNSSSDEDLDVGPINANELEEIPHLTKEGMENQPIIDPVLSSSRDLSFPPEDVEERECEDDNDDEDCQLKLVPLHNEDTLPVKTDEEEEEKLEDYERTNDGGGEKPNSSSDEDLDVGPMNGNELEEIPHLTKEGMENQAIVDPVPSSSRDLSFPPEDAEEQEYVPVGQLIDLEEDSLEVIGDPYAVVVGRTSLIDYLERDFRHSKEEKVDCNQASVEAANLSHQDIPEDDLDPCSSSESTNSEDTVIGPLPHYPEEEVMENQPIIDPVPSSSRDHSLPPEDVEEQEYEDDDDDDDEYDIQHGNKSEPDIEKGALDLIVHSYPNKADLIYELTCVVCLVSSGPPQVSCPYGHVICPTCYKRPRSLLTTCPAKVYLEDEITEGYCGGEVTVIDDAVKLSSCYVSFLNHAKYECGAKAYGCNAVLLGSEIQQHEKYYCQYKFIRFCGFQKDGCLSSFESIDHHLYHLIVAHRVPLECFSEGQVLLRYDREEYFDNHHNSFSVKPLVRAILETKKKSIICFLMAEDLEDATRKVRFTRIYLANVSCHDVTYKIAATLTISASCNTENGPEEKPMERELAVLPSIKDVVTVDQMKDKNVFLDIDNKQLDKFGMVQGGKKYVQLMVKLAVFRECSDDEDDEDSQLKRVPLHNEDTLPVKTEEEEEEEEKLEDYERTNDGRGERPNLSSDEDNEYDSDDDAKSADELEEKARKFKRKADGLSISGISCYPYFSPFVQDEDMLETEQEVKEERRRLYNYAESLQRKAQSKRLADV